MVKIKELSEDLRSCIVTAHHEGEGYKAISNHFKVPVPTIQSIIKKFKKYHTVKNLQGCGRKPTVSPALAQHITRQVNNNPRLTAKEILRELSNSGMSMSRQTLSRTLHKSGLHACRPRRTPLLTAKHRKSRIDFAKAHVNKDDNFWSSILWSDETKLELFGH